MATTFILLVPFYNYIQLELICVCTPVGEKILKVLSSVCWWYDKFDCRGDLILSADFNFWLVDKNKKLLVTEKIKGLKDTID